MEEEDAEQEEDVFAFKFSLNNSQILQGISQWLEIEI